MEDTRELNDFQKAFRDKALAEEAANRENEEFDEEYDIDTQHGRYMTFRCDNDYYGIAITNVSEIIGIQPITELPDTADFIKGLINLRGKIIPIIDIRARFGKPEIEYNDRTCVIVLTVEEDTVAMIVDGIADVVVISDENVLDPPSVNKPGANKFVFGIGKVGDSVKFLLDPAKLIYDKAQQ